MDANVISWVLSARDSSEAVFEKASARLSKIGLLTEGVSGKGAAMGAGFLIGGAMIAKGVEAVVDKALEFEDAFAKMNRSLGSNKKQAEAWNDVFREVYSASPAASLNSVGDAIAYVGRTLEGSKAQVGDFVVEMHKLAKVNKEDVQPLTEAITQSFNRWGIGIDQIGTKADLLTKVSQKTGASITELASGVTSGAQQFQLAGLTWDQSAVLLGRLSKYGIDASGAVAFLAKAEATLAKESLTANDAHEKSVSALQKLADKYGIAADANMENYKALGLSTEQSQKFADAQDKVKSSAEGVAKAQISLKDALAGVFDKIKNAATDQEAFSLAVEAFGPRAGKFATAIRSGALSLDDMTKSLGGTKGALDQTLAANSTLEDKMASMKRQVNLAEEAIGKGLTPVLLAVITPLAGVAKAVGAFLAQNPEIAKWIGYIGAMVAALLLFAGVVKIVMLIVSAFEAVGGVFSGVGAMIRGTAVAAEASTVAIEGMTVAEGEAAVAGTAMTASILPFIAAAVAVAAVAYGIWTAFHQVSAETQVMNQLTEAFSKNLEKMSVNDVAKSFEALGKIEDFAGQKILTLTDYHKLLGQILREQPQNAEKFVAGLQKAGVYTDTFTAQLQRNKHWMEWHNQSLLDGAEAALRFAESQQTTTDALASLDKARAEAIAKPADIEAQNALAGAMNNAKEAILGQLHALDQAIATNQLSGESIKIQVAALEQLKTVFPELAPVIQAHIDKLNGLPPFVKTTVSVDDQLSAPVQDLHNKLDGLHLRKAIPRAMLEETVSSQIDTLKGQLAYLQTIHSKPSAELQETVKKQIDDLQKNLSDLHKGKAKPTADLVDNAQGGIDTIERKLKNLNGYTATTYVNTVETKTQRAHGGWVPGAFNTPFDITAHGGEYVINPYAAAKLGAGVLSQLNQGKIPTKFVPADTLGAQTIQSESVPGGGKAIQLIVNNPLPEPASDTLQRRLTAVGKLGLFEEVS